MFELRSPVDIMISRPQRTRRTKLNPDDLAMGFLNWGNPAIQAATQAQFLPHANMQNMSPQMQGTPQGNGVVVGGRWQQNRGPTAMPQGMTDQLAFMKGKLGLLGGFLGGAGGNLFGMGGGGFNVTGPGGQAVSSGSYGPQPLAHH